MQMHERDELRTRPTDQTFDQDDPVVQARDEAVDESDVQGVDTLLEDDPIHPPLDDSGDPEASIYGVNPDKPVGARKTLNPDS